MEGVKRLEFLWLPKIDELNEINSMSVNNDESFKPCKPLINMKIKVSKVCGFPLFVINCKPRIEFDKTPKKEIDRTKAENALFYAEYLYVVTCNMKCEKDVDEDYKRFIKYFCSCDELNLDCWLKIDLASTSDSGIHTSDQTVDLTGFSLGNFCGLTTFAEHFNSKTSLQKYNYKITQTKLKLLHDYKKIILYFVVGKDLKVKKRNATTHRFHKLEVQYGAIHSIIISEKHSENKTEKNITVYLRMVQSPLMYEIQQSTEESDDYIEYLNIKPNTPWFRCVDFFEGAHPFRKEFSMNTVLKMNFSKPDDLKFLYQILIHCKSIQVFFAPISLRENLSHSNKSIQLNDFNCFYTVQCILSYSFEIIDQLIIKNELENVKTFLQEKSIENPVALCEALYIMYEAIIKGNIIIFSYCLKELYKRLQKTSLNRYAKENNGQQNHLLMIKRVICTPTHFRLMPPVPTLKSRALRDCDPNFSLRVSIRDVDFNTVNYSLRQGFFKNLDEKLKNFFSNYIRNPLLQGIKIGNRNYKYIGSSTSQLKGHGMWFYAKDDRNMTAMDLRKTFGELEKIKKVPKYMARMGQTFSQSMGHITVPQEWTNVKNPEEDVKGGIKEYLTLENEDSESESNKPKKFLKTKDDGEENEIEKEKIGEPYVFSDGIGRISKELAEMVFKELKRDDKPSAMQIRYAGCKGMLVVDPTLEGKKILFRKSMKKFDSDNDSLEILKFSEKRYACLNRPFITILEQLGVKKENFLELQKEMIQNHITSMFDEYAACEFLNRNSLLRLDFTKMFTASIHFTEDPLFRSMIYSLFQKQIELLKMKASIEIPLNKGRAVFGVLDETFTLEYGQVFVQYSDWITDKHDVLEGTVLVTKNPCMHPGDVRKFEAIDVKALHHIVDCIVFPAKGPRPHPDEMAGSDLDGDEYHVIWLESMIFPNDNHKPMSYARPDNKEELDKPVTPADELDHFEKFIFNDDVGIIANAHLSHADKIKDGIFSEICLRLAKKYSLSLDFAKSGESTKIGKDRAIAYPDFMEKWHSPRTYLSPNALGYLFRNCKKLELGLDTERNEIDYILDTDLQHENWDEKYKKNALRMLKQYSKKVDMFIRTYGFENEGQLLAGALINPPKYFENRHDMMNLMALLEYEVQWIFRDFEQKFFAEFNGKPLNRNYTDEMHQKASAWYMVSYSKAKNEGSLYFGLPWAVVDVLVDLKNKNKKYLNPINCKTILENVIDKSISHSLPIELTSETGIETIYNYRLDVIDLADKVLTNWIKSQEEHFSYFNFKEIEKFISKVFDKVTSEIVSCDTQYIGHLKKSNEIKKAISPCYYIIQTILELARCGVQYVKRADALQELGLLSWITLIKISCTYNPQYLGILNGTDEYAETVLYRAQDNIIDSINLPLNDLKISKNIDFTKKLLTNEPCVREYLKKYTKLKEVEFRYIESRNKEEMVRVTVRGTRYSIEKLKDIAVLKDFYELVVDNKPPFSR